MNTFFILLLIVSHVLAAWLVIKHRRNVRHHRAAMPVIGSDMRLTEALHARLRDNAPQADWLHPAVLHGKINAWRNKEGAPT